MAMLAGQLAKVLIGARLVHLDAVAVRVHSAKLPKGTGNTLLGGVFKSHQRLVGPALTQGLGSGPERLER